jgi:hypothetical protein
MYYCKYRRTDNFIEEVSLIPFIQDEFYFVSISNSELPIQDFNIYVEEINENNEIITYSGILKEV